MKKLQDMTWEEIRRRVDDGATAILPLGSMEQHGPHLPVLTDTKLVESIAEKAVEGPKDAFVLAPTLWIGASNHHQEFFALSLRESTYIEVLADAMRSFDKAGFRRLFVLNGHGGNSSSLRVALSKIRQEGSSMLVGVAEYWSIAAKAIRKLRQSKAGGAAHAGELETSLMLHISPDAVRSGNIGANVPELPEGFEIDLVEGGAVSLSSSWSSVAATGQIGDGQIASAENGERFLGEIAAAVSKTLRIFHELETPR